MASMAITNNQHLTASASSTSIDLGALTDERGTPLTEYGLVGGKIRVLVTAASALGGTSPTIQVALQDSADNNTFANVLTWGQITSASHGTVLMDVALPTAVRRYIRLNYTLGGTSPSITVNANLVWGC